MELKDFIKTALTNLVEGVSEAKESLNDNICPSVGHAFLQKTSLVQDINGRYIETVQFDIAVTTENATNASAKAGIRVMGVGAGVDGMTESSHTSVSRIKFQVPIALGKKRT